MTYTNVFYKQHKRYQEIVNNFFFAYVDFWTF